MKKSDLEAIITRLTKELGAQRRQYQGSLRELTRQVKELREKLEEAERAPLPPLPVTEAAEDEDEEEELMSPLQRLCAYVKDAPTAKPGSTPLFTEMVDKRDITELDGISEHLFIALLQRDFGAEITERYTKRILRRHVLFRIVRYYGEAAEEGELNISDEMRAAAEAAQQAEAEQKLQLQPTKGEFRLRGRQELERFFNDNVVDIINHHDVYSALGIDFPQPFILEGAPGCGKTFAVERLAEHLGWHTVHITSSTVGSQFVHATAKNIEEKFEEAAAKAPALLIIDEMDAFMPNRATVGEHNTHSAEEVGSFLKTIQTAAQKHVLVVGMTNLLQSIDPAILRTGRMGTHITVGMPSLTEVEDVLSYALEKRPHADFPLTAYARQLLDRPLSDVTFAVDEAAMHAARERRTMVEEQDLAAAVERLQERSGQHKEHRPIGFAA